jgi:anti-sigma regulatory factor (Ser/Thr protein kinase)
MNMDSATPAPEQEVIRISLKAKLEFIPATIEFINNIASKFGLTAADAQKLELVVEEACVNVVEHAFDPGEDGKFDIVIKRKPGAISISVEDQGLPFDYRKFENRRESGLGVVLMKAFTDEVYFHNLGKQGKQVELVKHLPYKNVEDYISDEDKAKVMAQPAFAADIPLEIRIMKPEESYNLARCVYRSYGYSYIGEHIYYPERVKELIESGVMVSCIAVTPENEIVGHAAISLERSDARVGETGQAVIDPRLRGRGILNDLALNLRKYAREHDFYGVFSEAVTVHTRSQKTQIYHGGAETGVLLGIIPATMEFKKIQNGPQQKRQSIVLYYTRLNQEPSRDVFPPLHHQGIIRRIYEKNSFKRNIINPLETHASINLPAQSTVDIIVKTEPSFAYIQIHEYGEDMEGLVKFRLNELCSRKIEVIYLDLPLCHPATPRICASMEILGFFFGGVIPELRNGDILRLQYLNNAVVDYENMQIATDFGKELCDYIEKSRIA